MPYIPQFNKLSLNEMAYAPSLLRQQHDDAVAKQMELAEALKFDYLKQDAPGIEPVLQQYNTDIEDVSNQIAQQGFTQDIKNKVLGLRSKFVTDDKIRQYKKNYSDAMTGWEDLKKRMIQEGRPGDDINKQKAAYFSGYKGAFDNEGFKQEFTPGRTSGYYDIAEDAKKAMSNLGTTGIVVGKGGSSIVEKTGVGADRKPFTYFEVTDSKTGQKLSNLTQRQAVERYLMAEYGDPTTDRGLFAQLSGITPEHIQNTIANVSQSMEESRYAQLPQTDISISGMSRATGTTKSMPNWNPSQYQRVTGVPDSLARGDEKLSKVLSGIDPKSGMFNPNLIKEDSGVLTKLEKEALKQTEFYVDPLVEGAIDLGRDVLGMKKLNRSDDSWSHKKSKELSWKTRSDATELFESSKRAYAPIYEDIMKNGYLDPNTGRRIKGNDQLFLNMVAGIERNNAVKKDILYGLDDPDIFNKILFKATESPSSKTFIEMNKNGSEGEIITKDEMLSKMNESKISDKKQILVNDDGDMFVQIGDKDWKINREVLPVQLKTDKESIKLIKDGLYNYRLTKKQMEDLANTDFSFGNISVRIGIDPNNPQMRRSLIVSDPQNMGQEIVLDSPAQLQLYMVNQIYKGASYETHQKPSEQ